MNAALVASLFLWAASLPPDLEPSLDDENMAPVPATTTATPAPAPALEHRSPQPPKPPVRHEAAPSPPPTPTVEGPPRPLEAAPPEPVAAPSAPAPASAETPREAGDTRAPRPLGVTLAWALVSLVLAQLVGGVRRGLAERGVLPRAVGLAQGALRLAAVALLFGAGLRMAPAALTPYLPWAVVAVAAAFGWSARDVLPDLLAGLVLAIERRVRPGQWIAGATFHGQVQELGLRASRILEPNGRVLTLPNRRLVSEPIEVEAGPGPTVQVALEVPPHLTPARVQRTLRDATLLSPWLAPDARISVQRAEGPGAWVVRTQLIEGRFEEAFASALREHVDELAHAPTDGLREA